MLSITGEGLDCISTLVGVIVPPNTIRDVGLQASF